MSDSRTSDTRAPSRRPSQAITRAGVVSLLFFLLILATPGTAAADAPEQLSVGSLRLVRCCIGTRSMLFVDLYRVAFFSPSADAGVATLQDPSLPRAVWVEILYAGSLPYDIPPDWREELVPSLPEDEQAPFRRYFRRLQSGDVLRVEYAPGGESVVRLNDERILGGTGHALINAFVDIWLGDDPVSPSLKAELLD